MDRAWKSGSLEPRKIILNKEAFSPCSARHPKNKSHARRHGSHLATFSLAAVMVVIVIMMIAMGLSPLPILVLLIVMELPVWTIVNVH